MGRGWWRHFELDALDRALLVVVLLSVVPGARALAAWPTIWFVPGWFLARRVMGIEGFARVALAVALSVALTTLVCLPLTAIVGSITPVGVAASGAHFALACSHTRLRFPVAVPPLPKPPAPFIVLLAAFSALRVAGALRTIDPDLSTPDGAYFVGMVRSLAVSFPPRCAEAAGHRLTQPWGYWFAYAASHVTSGASIAQTLGLVSAISAAAFAGVLYLAATLLTGDRLAGTLTLPLALSGGGAQWIAHSLAARRFVGDRLGWGGVTSSAENMWDGFYDLPALVVLTLALLFASLALRERSRRLSLAAFGLAMLLPFHHPAYFVVGAVAAGAALVFEIGRRRAPWLALIALMVAPIPFYVLFVQIYAGGLPPRAPFFTDVISIPYYLDRGLHRIGGVIAFAGLWLPFAVFAAWRAPITARTFFVALLGTSCALAVLTDNAAHNTHWTLDPLGVALVVLTASACAAAIRRRRRLGLALTVGLVGLGVVAGHWERRLPEHLAEIAHPAPHATPDARELAAWVKGHSREGALVVAPANDSSAIGAIEGLAERRVYDGFRFHLALTLPDDDLRLLDDVNRQILRGPEALARATERVDYVLHVAHDETDETEDESSNEPKNQPGRAHAHLWSDAAAPAFENGSFVLYMPLR